MIYWIFLILYAALYIFAGINHFRKPWFYYKMTPPFIKSIEKPVNIIVGAAELIAGIALLFPQTRVAAAWTIIALLVAVFPANIYMLMDEKAGMKIDRWKLYLRLPIQFLFIAWAYYYTTH